MKYFVFAVAAMGVPPLAFLLYMNRWWQRYAVYAVFATLTLWHPTAINFFSHEFYRGSSRGMEVSLVYLIAAALLLAMAFRKRVKGIFPDAASRLYLVYFLLCLPSFGTAANPLFSWFEAWKMAMVHVVWLTAYWYLRSSRDAKTVLKGFAMFAVLNVLLVLRDQYFVGVYQPHGVFPHRNSMAMGMQAIGPVFFAYYLRNGVRRPIDRLFFAGFACAALATVRSFSRMSILLLPFAYGLAALACRTRGTARTWRRRILPMVVLGLVASALLAPRIVERFLNAPGSSGETRVQLALCAWEMIKDHPFAGVGMNNWGVKINPPYRYAERAGRDVTGLGDDHDDGVVETIYLLVGAECGIPALLALLAWFAWHLWLCVRLRKRLEQTPYAFIPAGMLGGLSAVFVQSAFEWVLRQQLNFVCLAIEFAMLSWLAADWRRLAADVGKAVPEAAGKGRNP